MINVLHLVNGEQYSGLERVVDHLADAASEYGYRFHLVCLKPGEMTRRISTRKAQIHCVPMHSRFDLNVARKVQRVAVTTNSRLIHSHTARSALVARMLKNIHPLPWVHHVHSPARYESENKFLNYVNWRVEKRVLAKADKLIPVSDALNQYVHLQYRIPTCKIDTIYNGVPIVSNVREKPGGSEGPPEIGMVGLFRPRKGVETLLLACQQLLERGVEFNLKLIGEFVSDAYRLDVKRLVVRLGLVPHVEYTGFIEDVTMFLGRLDLFVLPSLYGEGLPMALLEAMAMRRVVIASAVDGISEVLGRGRYGFLVAAGDFRGLAAAIETALISRDTSEKLAVAAQVHQQQHYSVHAMAQRLFEVYHKCLLRN